MNKTNTQLLDPIGALAKVAMLGIYPPKTKLRITDHTLQLVPHTFQERAFFRPFVYQDSNENISGLYAAIVTFIELYLIKDKYSKLNKQAGQDKEDKISNDITHTKSNSFNLSFSPITQTSSHLINLSSSPKIDITINNDAKLRNGLVQLAECCRKGIIKLQETYYFNNGVFALQLFSNLLKSACEGTYDESLIPPHLLNLTKNSSLDEKKMKQIWRPEYIITLGSSLHECFATNNQTLRNSYISAIETLLNDREIEFQKFVLSTTNLTIDINSISNINTKTFQKRSKSENSVINESNKCDSEDEILFD
jgi:hypothetical protein